MVDGGEADIFVAAAVAGDEVRVEQLVVVVGGSVARVTESDLGVAVGDLANRHGGVGDVVQESVAGPHCQVRDIRQSDRSAQDRGHHASDGRRARASVRRPSHHDLREAVRRCRE